MIVNAQIMVANVPGAVLAIAVALVVVTDLMPAVLGRPDQWLAAAVVELRRKLEEQEEIVRCCLPNLLFSTEKSVFFSMFFYFSSLILCFFSLISLLFFLSPLTFNIGESCLAQILGLLAWALTLYCKWTVKENCISNEKQDCWLDERKVITFTCKFHSDPLESVKCSRLKFALENNSTYFWSNK